MKQTHPLSIRDVSVRYQRTFPTVVESVSFVLEPATLTALVGPNGSGKSTLLKAMVGLLPYEGAIEYFGNPLTHHHHDIGYVPQTHSIDTSIPLTVTEFLRYSHAACPEATRNAEHSARVLGTLNATHLLQLQMHSLSGGQLQRVLLARALMHQPKILLLDEPEAGIDVGGEKSLYTFLRELTQADGITVLVASHELDSINHYADRVICINHCIVCDGKPSEVLTELTFTKLYGPHAHG